MAKWKANTYVNIVNRVNNLKRFFWGDVPNEQGPSHKEKRVHNFGYWHNKLVGLT
jgi:hypothetical protein